MDSVTLSEAVAKRSQRVAIEVIATAVHLIFWTDRVGIWRARRLFIQLPSQEFRGQRKGEPQATCSLYSHNFDE